MVQAADAAEGAGRDVPGHAVVAEVGQRVAHGGQLPVQHRQHARFGGVEDQVVEPEVAVHHRHHRLVARAVRDVLRQPFDQPVHGLVGAGDRGLVLLAPARDLALEIVAGPAEIGQAECGHIQLVQRGDDAVHLVVDRRALLARHARQRLVPEHAALHELHHVEGAADDRFVLAQQVHARHRHLAAGQRVHDPELALHRMGRGQQPGRRARAWSASRRRPAA